ncbi:MAG: hypothetical protein JOZ41_11225, partial [Chloroflexi bacterium]|nr:hypothetical protein [Chloroflexota bacterium]
MGVEELAAVVGMQLLEREGQTIEHPPEAPFPGLLAPAQDRHPLAPAGGHVDQLEGVDVVPLGAPARMVDQVGLAVPRLGGVPGDAAHRDLLPHPIGLLGPAPGQTGLVLPEAGQQASRGGPADASQLPLQLRGQPHLPEAGQVLRRGEQARREPRGTDVIQALPRHPDHILHPRAIHAASLSGAGPPLQPSRVQQPDQAAAMQPR